LAGSTLLPARWHSVRGSLSPGGAICPQVQISKPGLPEHGAIASHTGDGDCERLLQMSKTGEGRAPVPSAELESGDGSIAAVPADDLPGKRVGLGRPGDSNLITSRPNEAEAIPTRACPTAPEVGSAWRPDTACCWLTAHVDANDPNDDHSLRELVRRLEHRAGEVALLELPEGFAKLDLWRTQTPTDNWRPVRTASGSKTRSPAASLQRPPGIR